MKAPIALLGPTVLYACASAGSPGRDDMQVIADVERGIALPAGAADLREYTRHYSSDADGRLRGVLIQDGGDAVRIVPDGRLPVVFDGGCGVVWLEYDLPSRRMISIACNGSG